MADLTMTRDALRARFNELGMDRAAILATSTPLREQRDKLVRDVTTQAATLEAQVKTIEAPLFDLDQERAMLARALGGRTGDPVEA